MIDQFKIFLLLFSLNKNKKKRSLPETLLGLPVIEVDSLPDLDNENKRPIHTRIFNTEINIPMSSN